MAGVGDGGLPPPQDMVDTDPTMIKLFLGTQVPGGQEVTVKRAALRLMSPVFNNMLTHDMLEAKEGKVRLERVSMDVWNVISAFYFCCEDLLSEDNVQEVVCIADMYELTVLKDHCDGYLSKRTVSTDDQAELWKWAGTMRLAKLKKKFSVAASKHFESFCQSGTFLRLNTDVLLEILCGPSLVGDEHIVCLAVIRWLQAQNAERQLVETLFQQLKLTEVCLSCLEKHAKELENVAVREVVLQLLEKEKQERKRGLPDRFPLQYFVHSNGSKRVLHRFPSKMGNLFSPKCACAGVDKDGLILIVPGKISDHAYEVRSSTGNDTLNFLADVPGDLIDDVVACLLGNLMVVKGGVFGHSIQIYNLKTKKWSKGPLLLEQRETQAMVAVGDAVYMVMGRGTGGRRLSSIEKYRQNGVVWQLAGHMEQAADSVCAATSGSLIIAQGRTCEKMASLQCFNTETKTAVVLESTPYVRDVSKAFTIGGKAVVFVQNGEFTLVYSKWDGELSVAKHQMPDFVDVFVEEENSCSDTEKMHSGQPSSEMTKLASGKCQSIYFVQHDLVRKRVNLRPFLPFVGAEKIILQSFWLTRESRT